MAGLLLLVIAVSAILLLSRPRFSETEVRQRIVSSIKSEAPGSFYVTGTLDVTATSTVEDTKYLIPPLRLNLGTTSATVRLPGRVTYGFDARALSPDHVRVLRTGEVEVTIPDLEVYAVEPDLRRMEIQTDVGWARTYAGSGQEVTREAMSLAQDILRQQGDTHLRGNAQPRINAARALATLLTPILQSAGIENPTFRFQIGPELIMQPED